MPELQLIKIKKLVTSYHINQWCCPKLKRAIGDNWLSFHTTGQTFHFLSSFDELRYCPFCGIEFHKDFRIIAEEYPES
jgi:hypothetical protein